MQIVIGKVIANQTKVEVNMAIKVVVKHNNIEKALSIFKRKVKDSNLIFELREREFYKKKSELKKEKKNKAKARNYWKKIKLMEEDSRKRGRKF